MLGRGSGSPSPYPAGSAGNQSPWPATICPLSRAVPLDGDRTRGWSCGEEERAAGLFPGLRLNRGRGRQTPHSCCSSNVLFPAQCKPGLTCSSRKCRATADLPERNKTSRKSTRKPKWVVCTSKDGELWEDNDSSAGDAGAVVGCLFPSPSICPSQGELGTGDCRTPFLGLKNRAGPGAFPRSSVWQGDAAAPRHHTVQGIPAEAGPAAREGMCGWCRLVYFLN